MQTLIAGRLSDLAPELRRWLERLAVIGGRIEPEFVIAAFPPSSRKEVDDLLAGLVRTGWLVAAGARYRFARPALREAVYRTMNPGRRKRLHAAAARGLAASAPNPSGTPTTPSTPTPEELFQRSFHLRAAEAHGESLELVLSLLERLHGRASANRMLVLARWGLQAIDHLPHSSEHADKRLFLLEVAAPPPIVLARGKRNASFWIDSWTSMSTPKRTRRPRRASTCCTVVMPPARVSSAWRAVFYATRSSSPRLRPPALSRARPTAAWRWCRPRSVSWTRRA